MFCVQVQTFVNNHIIRIIVKFGLNELNIKSHLLNKILMEDNKMRF